MIQITPQLRVLVAVEPVDFRCGIDRLAQLCRTELGSDPFSGTVFVFRNRRGTGIRVLVYDGRGFWLCYLRLSRGRFRWWPQVGQQRVSAMEAHELAVLFIGGDPRMTGSPPMWRRVDGGRRSGRGAGERVFLWLALRSGPAGGARPRMGTVLTYRGRAVSERDVAFIRELIAAHPQESRRGLSRKLCEAWGWVQPNGRLRDMVCRSLMLELHRAGHIELPPVRARPPNPLARRARPAPVVDLNRSPIRCRPARSGIWCARGRPRSSRCTRS